MLTQAGPLSDQPHLGLCSWHVILLVCLPRRESQYLCARRLAEVEARAHEAAVEEAHPAGGQHGWLQLQLGDPNSREVGSFQVVTSRGVPLAIVLLHLVS